MKTERLLKLLDHMENGKLSVDKFDFRWYNYTYPHPKQKNVCKTIGCMAGELPSIFPKQWKMKRPHKESSSSNPYLKRGSTNDVKNDLEIFFELDSIAIKRLFYPRLGSDQDSGEILPLTATRKQVAKNLRKFLEEKGVKIPKKDVVIS